MKYSGFTDIHCHVVPFVDDGADAMETSQAMIGMAYKSGTRRIIATPHYGTARAKASSGRIVRRFKMLEDWVESAYPDMEIYLGQELSYHSGIEEEIKRGRALTMADSQYALIEFRPGDQYSRIRQGLESIRMSGYRPILAHAERCEVLAGNVDYVDELVHMGIYVQVNASSITGKNGRFIKGAVKKMLKRNLVHLVGSDGHDLQKRKPVLIDAVKDVKRHYGWDYTERLFISNPECIIYNQYIER